MKFSYMSPFDADLKRAKGIQSLPWVGKEYGVGSAPKLLIVGESDYEHDEIDNNDRLRARKVTGYNLTDEGIAARRPLYDGVEKALYGKGNLSNEQKRRIWNSVSYYNLCQRVVQPGERPSFEDYYNGWNSLFEVISILKPEHSIITSSTAASMYGKGILDEHPGKYTASDWDNSSYEPISKAKPSTIVMNDADGYKLRILFIRHPSAYFSWRKWHDQVIRHELELYCSWLKSQT